MSQFTILSKNRPTHPFAETLQLLTKEDNSVVKLEEEFAEKVDAKHAVAFPHCRVAVRAILESSNIPGSEVALTAYTCVVIPHSVVLAGRTPVFVDIDPETFNTPVSALWEKVGPQTQAVLATSMYGNTLDFSVMEENAVRPILLIEDNELSVHKAFAPNNRNIQAASVYSLDFNKPLSALYGGMAVTNDFLLAERLRNWRKKQLKKNTLLFQLNYFAKFVAAQMAFRPLGYTVFERVRKLPMIDRAVDTRFMDVPGFPPTAEWEFSPLQARVALSQLQSWDSFLNRRWEISRKYEEAFKGISDISPMKLFPDSHLSHYTIRVKNRDGRQFREKMAKLGVEVGKTLDYSVTTLPYYRERFSQSFPETEKAAREIVNLPNYPLLTAKEQARVIEAVKKSL